MGEGGRGRGVGEGERVGEGYDETGINKERRGASGVGEG